MSKRVKLAAIAVLTVFALVAIAGRETDMYRNVRISPSEAHAKMQAHPNAIILDVRTSGEFAAGRIPGAILLPNDEIRFRAQDVLPNKNALILVYCRSGARSQDAAENLIYMGYTNVFDFGGILDWPYAVQR